MNPSAKNTFKDSCEYQGALFEGDDDLINPFLHLIYCELISLVWYLSIDFLISHLCLKYYTANPNIFGKIIGYWPFEQFWPNVLHLFNDQASSLTVFNDFLTRQTFSAFQAFVWRWLFRPSAKLVEEQGRDCYHQCWGREAWGDDDDDLGVDMIFMIMIPGDIWNIGQTTRHATSSASRCQRKPCWAQ